jgi:hypothetical protein
MPAAPAVRNGSRDSMRLLICRLLLLTAPLAGCAGTFEQQSLFAQPGKFRFLPCKDLAARGVGLATRERELTSLMERASQGTGGSIINPLVYGPDLEQVRADTRELQKTQNEKNCNAPAGRETPSLR